MDSTPARPGSAGEHELQKRFGTTERANRFYSHQMLDYLNDRMQIFVGRQEMIFIATSDAHGDCDCSFRAGPPGFVRVLDEKAITWPEYRGNGVLASAGNIAENAHVGVLMIDFVKDVIGLHVNGKAEMVADEQMRQSHPWLIEDDAGGRSPERWIVLHVEEAYVHCSKHIPRMVRVPNRRSVGVGEKRRELKRKGGDYFAARTSPSPWKEALAPDGAGEETSDEPTEGPAPEPTAEPAPEPVGEYDTCGLDLPDGQPEATPAADDDGTIWNQLTAGGRGPDLVDRHEPRHAHRDPLAAAAAAAAEVSEGLDASEGAEDGEASSSTPAQGWSPAAPDPWSSLWNEQTSLVDQDPGPDRPGGGGGEHAYVVSDAAATLLSGGGFDPYGSAARRREPDESDAG